MSKFDRRNGFAFGLAVGLGLAVVLSLALEVSRYGINPKAQKIGDGSVSSAANSQEGDEEQSALAYWPRRFLSLEDTLAQWLMTVFSIIAAVLLWRTLTATQKMARDGRRIGEAQVRAYLSFKVVSVVFSENKADGKPGGYVKIYCQIKNVGQTPAFTPRIKYDIRTSKVGEITAVMADGSDLRDAPTSLRFMAVGDIDETEIRGPHDVTGDLYSGPTRVCFRYMVEYKDVFGKKRNTSLTSGSFGLSPKDPTIVVFNPDQIHSEKKS